LEKSQNEKKKRCSEVFHFCYDLTFLKKLLPANEFDNTKLANIYATQNTAQIDTEYKYKYGEHVEIDLLNLTDEDFAKMRIVENKEEEKAPCQCTII